jgi:hypothetical protein
MGMTKFYVDAQGRYVGGFDGAEPPVGAIEVAEPPQRGTDIWANNIWTVVSIVPEQVTMRQARLALLAAGLLANVDAAINLLPSPMKEEARIEWDYSSTVERHRSLVQALGGTMGLTEDQLDALFIQAATL